MSDTVVYEPPAGKKPSIASASYRCWQLHGEAPSTWEGRYHAAYQQVARMNVVLRSLGLTDVVMEKMAVIDASLAPVTFASLTDLLHEAQIADVCEEPADETFRHKLQCGTATVAEARDALRKSAVARGKAELAEAALLHWIEEKEAKA